MTSPTAKQRPWSKLSEAERRRLLAHRQEIVDLAREIGPRATGAQFGCHWRIVASWVAQDAPPRREVPYAPQPPGDLKILARQLGYSTKALGRKMETHGDDTLGVLQTEWRKAQERGRFLDVNAANEPTSDPSRAVDAQLVDERTQKSITQRAWEDFALARLAIGEERRRVLEQVPPEFRLGVLRKEAKRRGKDIRSDVKAIERRMDEIERKLAA